MRQSEKKKQRNKNNRYCTLFTDDKLLTQKVKGRLIFSVSYFVCAEDDESDMDQEGIYYSHKKNTIINSKFPSLILRSTSNCVKGGINYFLFCYRGERRGL